MPEAPSTTDRPIGLWTGTLLVIANMVGVGVFITTGDLLRSIGSGPAVLVAWIVGGIAALCGALCYAELGAALPHNGGEFNILTRTYHPTIGFLSGWVSTLAGFCAPLALVAMTFQDYLYAVFPGTRGVPAALIVIAACALLHALNVRGGHRFQNVSTGIKVGLILAFVVLGLAVCRPAFAATEVTRAMLVFLSFGEHRAHATFLIEDQTFVSRLLSAPFALGLVEISFAYSGWNSAAYVAGEYHDSKRHLPLSLVLATSLVTLMYLALNFVFLSSAPANVLISADSGRTTTLGHTAAIHLFGSNAGRAMSMLILLGLVSSVGAFLVAGSRMMEAVCQRYWGLGWLASRPAQGGPVGVIVALAVGACIMVQLNNALDLLIWVGLTLSLFTFATVLSVFVLRFREPDLPRPYRVWGYPITPVVFLILQTWFIIHTVWSRPATALASAELLGAGLVVYAVLALGERVFGRSDSSTPSEPDAVAPAGPPTGE